MLGSRPSLPLSARSQTGAHHPAPTSITVCDRVTADALRRDIELNVFQINLTCNWNASVRTLARLAKRHIAPELLSSVSGIYSPPGSPLHNLQGLIPPGTSDYISDLILIAIVEAAGLRVFTLAEQHDGSIVHPIEPQQSHEREQSSLGRVRFDYHSDDPMFGPDLRVQGIHLLGRVNEHHCPTEYISVDRLLPLLDAETVRILSEPRFEHVAPASFNLGYAFVRSAPVLERVAYGFDIALELGAIRPVDDGEDLAESLRLLTQAIDETEPVRISIEPGCLLGLSNIRGLHARSDITGKRHLRRVYSRQTLQPLRALVPVPATSCVFSAAQLLGGAPTNQVAA